MSIFNRKPIEKKRSTALFLRNGSEDILVVKGYKPLSRDETVLRCAHKIADMVSNMTIMLMVNGEVGDIRIKNELSKKIDITPCKYMNRKNFIYRIVMDMVLYGNSVVVPTFVRGEGDALLLDNLIPLQSSTLVYTKTEDGKSYSIRSGQIEYKADEVLHFVLSPDSEKPFMGNGFSMQLKETVGNLLQANETKRGFLQSKYKPSLIISVNADTEELQHADTRKNILGSYLNDTERGEPWIIPAGEVDVKAISPLTLNDLAIQDSITLDTKTIASAFGMPPFMVGIGDFNRDAYNNFVETTIMSFAQILQQELTRKLLYSPDLYFRFNSKSLLQYSLNEKATYVLSMVNGGMLSRNEGRNEFDISPSDAEGMNDFALLENYIKVGDISKQKKLVGKEAENE